MKKIVYKKVNAIITTTDLIHLAMGYEIRIVDEDTYNRYLNDPLFGIDDSIDDEKDDNIII